MSTESKVSVFMYNFQNIIFSLIIYENTMKEENFSKELGIFCGQPRDNACGDIQNGQAYKSVKIGIVNHGIPSLSFINFILMASHLIILIIGNCSNKVYFGVFQPKQPKQPKQPIKS